MPNAEEAKTAEVAAYCWKALGQTGFTRTDVIVGVGGGATTDLAGFVAATWLRGVRWVAVPTTVLGMVDAAVGGKTGINTAEGKNLVGAFHPPAGVLCDLAALDSLPVNDYVSGLAEVIKAGFIADPAILDLIEADPEARPQPGRPAHRRARSSAPSASRPRWSPPTCKESGLREILNYGHTLGARHREERALPAGGTAPPSPSAWSSPPNSAASPGRLDDATADRHRAVLAVRRPAADLPRRPVAAAAGDDEGRQEVPRRPAALHRPGRPRPSPTVLEGPDPAVLLAAYGEVSA